MSAPILTFDSREHERFFGRVVEGDNGCWLWIGGTQTRGYGTFYFRGKKRLAHRVSYERAVGPIPDGLVIDHLCCNRQCVNPTHLEVVTNGENIRRGYIGKLKTHCNHGHAFTEDNTYHRSDGYRECQICRRTRDRERHR